MFESLFLCLGAVPQKFQHENGHGLPVLPQLSEEELKERQRVDPELKVVIRYLKSGKRPVVKVEPVDVALWLREWNRLVFKNGILFRRRLDRRKCVISTGITSRPPGDGFNKPAQ